MRLPTDDFGGASSSCPETDRSNGNYVSTIVSLGFWCLVISLFLIPVFKSIAPFLIVFVFIILGLILSSIKENIEINRNRREK